MPATFAELIELAGQNRDVRLRHSLETGVRLVRYEPGRIDLRLDGAPSSLPSELTEKLKRWTGQRWMISLSSEQGAPTVLEQTLTREQKLKREAMEDPLVKSVLKVFPGAEIVAVRAGMDDAMIASDTVDGEEALEAEMNEGELE